MEQKTEASQAVDEPALPHLPRAVGYRHTMDNTEGLKGNKPVTVFCATKPNPFGIPGLDYSASFPVTTETLFTATQMKAYARAALKAQPAPTEAPSAWMAESHVGNGVRAVTKFALDEATIDRYVSAEQASFAGCERTKVALYRQPAPTEAAQGEDSARLFVAVKAYRDLQCKIRAAGRPPHSDYWHQSLYEAEAAIDAALASAETGGVKP